MHPARNINDKIERATIFVLFIIIISYDTGCKAFGNLGLTAKMVSTRLCRLTQSIRKVFDFYT